jgi:hypothetical protein
MVMLSVERSQYVNAPWDQLRTSLARADGAIVFGFRQLHMAAGDWRPDTPEARSAAGWYPTAWNQIEAGLAIMARVPVLLTPDPDVTNGVFAADVWGDNVYGFPRPSANGDLDFTDVAFTRWAEAVREQALRRTG